MNRYLVFLLLSSYFGNGQIDGKFSLVSKHVDKQVFNELPLKRNPRNYQGRNTLLYSCSTGEEKKYADNESEENYIKYEELGVFKNSIIIISEMHSNSEKLILLNLENCDQIVLEGVPLQIENTNRFLVYNNPGTDEPFIIQILKFYEGFFVLEKTIIVPKKIILKRVLRVDGMSVFMLDVDNKIWKTTF